MAVWARLSLNVSLMSVTIMPLVMLLSYFLVLRVPNHLLHGGCTSQEVGDNSDNARLSQDEHIATLGKGTMSNEKEGYSEDSLTITLAAHEASPQEKTFKERIRAVKALLVPYIIPLFFVYWSQYTANSGVSPTLLFPLEKTPFSKLTDHYIYYTVYIVFAIMLWEGLVGGCGYVNTYANISKDLPESHREFSMGACGVGSSLGASLASFTAMGLEIALCQWQVSNGSTLCHQKIAQNS
ncbi:battenin CLN3 protein [Dispira parvispora]|uniref:Battenin CLN3 protein n=1 Tax=Dispira parvispora TaxID=1520584 RepID=A0A9W8AT04_9FUNG|nr:battenin CLN3 protein [Dispira parvispora]